MRPSAWVGRPSHFKSKRRLRLKSVSAAYGFVFAQRLPQTRGEFQIRRARSNGNGGISFPCSAPSCDRVSFRLSACTRFRRSAGATPFLRAAQGPDCTKAKPQSPAPQRASRCKCCPLRGDRPSPSRFSPNPIVASARLFRRRNRCSGYPASEDIVQHWGQWEGHFVLDWRPHLSFTDCSTHRARTATRVATPVRRARASPRQKRHLRRRTPLMIHSRTSGYQSRRCRFWKSRRTKYSGTFDPEYVDAYEFGMKNTRQRPDRLAISVEMERRTRPGHTGGHPTHASSQSMMPESAPSSMRALCAGRGEQDPQWGTSLDCL